MKVIGNKKIDFDFHIHTMPGSKDAHQSVNDMFDTALDAGLTTVAITDHNSIASLKEAITLAKEKGLKLICGVELSSGIIGISNELDYEIIHVLGLGINHNEELFASLTKEANERVNKWFCDIKKMCEKKFNMSFKSNEIYQLREEMVNLGLFKDRKEAKSFTRNYKGNDVTPLMPIPINEIIDVIHKLGGIAILAHPNRGENHKRFNTNEIEQIVDYLVSKGLDGIELYHPNVVEDKEVYEKVKELVNKYNLLTSLGVDRHKAFDSYGDKYYRQDDFITDSNIDFENVKNKILDRINYK